MTLDAICESSSEGFDNNKFYKTSRFLPFSNKAFSLLETLVVTGIIVVLVGMMLPAVQYARELGRRSKCSQNLSQIGVACKMYAKDNNEYWPWNGIENGEAFLTLPKYIPTPTTFLCPADHYNKITVIDNWKVNNDNSIFASYIAANFLNKYAQRDSDPVDAHAFWDLYWNNLKEVDGQNHGVRRGNVLHLGGHVKWYEWH